MASYFIETYGCQMNLADSELLSGILTAAGWQKAHGVEDADVIIINTCAVRERAATRAIGHVQSYRPLLARRPHVKLVLAGCLARYGDRALAERLPEVDLLIGPDGYRRLPELLAAELAPPHLAIEQRNDELYDDVVPVRRPGVNAWVSITRGCERHCAYCVVPLTRGRERSLPAAAVVAQVREAVAQGFGSVTLLGQAVTAYDDGRVDFAGLLEAVARIEGLRRLRFLSAHPADFDHRLLETIALHPAICPHIHLPVQSGSDRILAAMRRGYTCADYRALVLAAREAIPGLAITTDLIAGFPGETEEDFAATLELMRFVRFDGAFMFIYSPRPGTYAAQHLADDVDRDEKRRRISELVALQEEHSRQRFGEAVGRHVEVMIEGTAQHPAGWLFGKTADFKDTIFEPSAGARAAPGELADVLVTAATSHTLLGAMAEPQR